MKIIPAKTPGFVKTLFPNFIWNINTNSKTLYLTFDDGPTPEITDWVLSTLKQYNAKATFFCIGNNIEKHPKIFQNIVNDGHAIGNHTYNHLKGWKHKTATYIEDVKQTQVLMDSTINNQKSKIKNLKSEINKLFRPPYGKFKVKQSRKIQDLDYRIIMWDVLSYDWDKSVSENDCLQNVVSSAKEGSIIVFHDSVKASKNLKFALPKVLEHFTNAGFSFKRIEQSAMQ